MATINLNIKKPKRVKWKKYVDEDTKTDLDYYNSMAWRKLRRSYISEHPLCEECLKHNVITPAIHVHHLRPFMSEKTETARWNTLLNEKNLRSLCYSCHRGYHRKMRTQRIACVDSLGDDEYSQAQMMYATVDDAHCQYGDGDGDDQC